MLIFVFRMMKAILKYCLIATLSTVFVFVASGYNFVHYCCDSCESQGVEVLLSGSCDDAHEHEHEHELQAHACCANSMSEGIHAQQQKDDCELHFLKLDDVDISTTKKNLSYKYSESTLVFLPLLVFVSAYNPMAESMRNKAPDLAVLPFGRDLLSSVCILRI